MNRDVADSTFAEDSDTSTPRRPIRTPRKQRRSRIVEDGAESTTDALTDLERRVQAMRIWGGIEEERKMWLMNEIRAKKEASEFLQRGRGSESGEGSERAQSRSGSSVRLGSRGGCN